MPVQVLERKAVLSLSPDVSAEVYFYGATITSWKVGGQERLFLSKQSILDGTKGIRGGIPLVFPQFATTLDQTAATFGLPQHGIARISTWEYLGVTKETDSELTVQLVITQTKISEKLQQIWPKRFRLLLTIKLGLATLTSTVQVENKDTQAFDFNFLFHTYFSIPDISKVSVHGLTNLTYTDKVANGARVLDTKTTITIDQETDRVYNEVTNNQLLLDLGQGGKGNFEIEKINLKDTVVWNPWIEKSKGMTDFADEEYQVMACVETGTVASYVTLPAGGSWEGSQVLKVIQ